MVHALVDEELLRREEGADDVRPRVEAADALLDSAQGYGENDYKIPLARRTLAAVLAEATGMEL